MKSPPLQSFHVKNFKAIRDSKRIKFGWLTVFIGNNGVGKSSLIEALETFRDVVLDGIDPAFLRWRGFENVLNKARKFKSRLNPDQRIRPPMSFRFSWRYFDQRFIGHQRIRLGPGDNSLYFQRERLSKRREGRTELWSRGEDNRVDFRGTRSEESEIEQKRIGKLLPGESLFKRFAWETFDQWQFLMLNPDLMGQPTAEKRALTGVHLVRDGSNIAGYLKELRDLDLKAFEGLLETLRYVLPYAVDLQPTLASELGRAYYLKMKEGTFEIPGWLLSTGTLRIVALLAALRHPKPPPLLVIEEIENGLDPRTLHLVVEEIRAAIDAGRTQIILTTHSPYLLDLLDLSHIVVVEREEGQPVFRRPDAKKLAEWSKSFSPGRLYTMGRLSGVKP